MIELYDFQKGSVQGHERVALYWEMGLGKTYGGLDRAMQWNDPHVLIVCQKSKIDDWLNAVRDFTGETPKNLRIKKELEEYRTSVYRYGVINYDLLSLRKKELEFLSDFTLILDESSLIKNPKAKRTKAVMRLDFEHLVLLSGTPCSGKYEELITQCHLLGWKIDPDIYLDRYTNYISLYIPGKWNPVKKFTGYKNVRELKQRLVDHGADFKMSKDFLDLPKQNFYWQTVPAEKEYRVFEKNLVVEKDGETITGDTPLVEMLRLRQLCCTNTKIDALVDMIEGTQDRVVVFYNFTEEMNRIKDKIKDRPFSFINGEGVDLDAYNQYSNTVVFCQYQTGAYGHNLQLANKMIFFSPPLSNEQFEQAKKRIHRIGQKEVCFYWRMKTKGTIEEKIYQTLQMRQDYTVKLFETQYLKKEEQNEDNRNKRRN